MLAMLAGAWLLLLHACSLHRCMKRCQLSHAVICMFTYAWLRSHKRYLQGDVVSIMNLCIHTSASTRCLCIRFDAGVVYRHTFDLA